MKESARRMHERVYLKFRELTALSNLGSAVLVHFTMETACRRKSIKTKEEKEEPKAN